MYRKHLIISLLFIVSLLTISCLRVDEIEFIPFQVDFQAATNVIIQEKIRFNPGEGTAGAQSFLWEFGDADSTVSTEQNPEFSYDTLGFFTVKLTAKIQKSKGLQEGFFTRNIRVLPASDTLLEINTLGTTSSDEIPQDFYVKKENQEYLLLGRKNLNTLTIYTLNNSLNIKHQKEISNLASGQIFGKVIRSTSDQGMLVVGYVQSSLDENDAFIVKLDSLGDFSESSWQKVITSIKNEVYNSIIESINGLDTSYFAIGTVFNLSSPTILIDRYSPQGVLLNSQSFENQCNNCKANAAILIPGEQENTLIIAGNLINTPTLFKFSLKNQVAVLEDRSSVNIKGEGLVVKQLSDGKFTLAGSINSGTDSTRAFIAKLDVVSQGVIPAWVTEVAVYRENFLDISEDTEGDILVLGNHFNPISQADALLVRLDTFSGRIKKINLLGGYGMQSGLRIWNNQNNLHLIGSQITDAGFGFRDIIVGKIPLN